MKIAIDCRFWGPKHTGLGIYTQNLVENLAKVDLENTYVLLIRKDDFKNISLPDNFSKVIVDVRAYSLAEQFIVPWKIYQIAPDLVHFTSINVPLLYFGKYVVTIHDLIKHFFRGTQSSTRNPILYWLKFLSYLVVFRWIIWWSTKILVPSEAVKLELLAGFSLPKTKIIVSHEAAVVKNVAENVPFTKQLPTKFAIYTGNAYPHKNIARLIRIWAKVFVQTKTSLVLIGARSTFTSRIESMIKEAKAEKYVSFLGFVQEEEIASLYRKATVYVFPSLSEGFGLPGLDAMQMGLPVVCSDIPVLREIYGDAALYFDPKDDSDMAKAIMAVINNSKIQTNLIKKGLNQVKKYSWEEMVGQTLAVYSSSVS